jgi:hypothetical protein
MAGSKNVLAVLGLMCVNRNFRTDFFVEPTEKAQQVFGTMTAGELEQINRLAGKATIPRNRTRDQFVAEVSAACEEVFASVDCTCPMPPCPCPDNNDLY